MRAPVTRYPPLPAFVRCPGGDVTVSLVGAAEKTALVPARKSLATNLRKIEPRLTDQDVRVIGNLLGYARGPVYPKHQQVMAALRNLVETPALSGSSTPESAASAGATAIYSLMQQK